MYKCIKIFKKTDSAPLPIFFFFGFFGDYETCLENHYIQEHVAEIYNDIEYVLDIYGKKGHTYELNYNKSNYLDNIELINDKILNTRENDEVCKFMVL